MNETKSSNDQFFLFTHGKPGALLIDRRWLNPEQIVDFLRGNGFTQKHLLIYGCEFGQGEIGKNAVAYLQEKLGANVSASDDITGKDGDWDLEVGAEFKQKPLLAYQYNLQCAGTVGGTGSGDNYDNDGVCNAYDLDDDNDGILDIYEKTQICDTNGMDFSNIGTNNLSTFTTITNHNLTVANTVYTDATYSLELLDYSGTGSSSWNEIRGNQNGDFSLSRNNGGYIEVKFTFSEPISFVINEDESMAGSTGATDSWVFTLPSTDSSYFTYSDAGTADISVNSETSKSIDVSLLSGDDNWEFKFYDVSEITMKFYSTGADNTSILNFYACEYVDQDTDADTIPDHLDLDSDNDGCLDALEGGDNVGVALLQTASGGATVGTGSTASDLNLGTTVDSNGVPTVVNVGGSADADSAQGQTAGTSQDNTQQAIQCTDPCYSTTDSDGDGLSDVCDLDDDNDGILDTDECGSLLTSEFTGTFGSNSGWYIRDLEVAPTDGNYTYLSTLTSSSSNNTLVPGKYVVMNGNVDNAHVFFSNLNGHTTGDLNDMYLAINGSTEIGVFFTSTFYLAQGQTYDFGFWAANANYTASGASNNPINLGYRLIRLSDDVIVASGNTGSVTTSHTWTNTSGTYTTGTTVEQYRFEVYNISTGSVGNDFAIDDIYFTGCGDYDGDGTPNYLDLDSDNDGCLDALEGDENVDATDLVTASGTVTVGVGSSASNQNLGVTIDSNGVPTIVNSGGSADVGGDQGQSIGDAYNETINNCSCYNDPSSITGVDTKHGITLLQRAGGHDRGDVSNSTDWPMIRKSAHTVLESNTKGFVITRMASPETTIGSDAEEGMMVYDTDDNCLKIYDGAAWSCFVNPSCP